MSSTRNRPRFASWHLRAYPQVVEYDQAVLDEIVRRVTEAFRKFPRGGLEVGGVLLGRGDRHLVRVLGSLPIPCEHASGPSFRLSEKDHAELSDLLESYRSEPSLAELIPVGWYVSHTRTGIEVDEHARAVHERHFSESGQLLLMLHPRPDLPLMAGIFVSGPDGGLPDSPVLVIDELGVPSRLPPELDAAIRAAAARRQGAGARLPETETGPAAEPVPAPPSPEWGPAGDAAVPSFGGLAARPAPKGWFPARRWLVPAVAAILLAAGAAAVRYLAPGQLRAGLGKVAASAGGQFRDAIVYWSDLTDPAPSPPLDLRVLQNGGQLLIRWDPSSRILRDAAGAVVEVTGGGQTERYELDRAQLLAGSVTHARRPGDAGIRLTVLSSSGEAYSEGTWYLAKAPGPEQPSGEEAQAELARVSNEVRLLEAEERLLKSRLDTLRRLAVSPESGVAPAVPALKPPPPAATVVRPPTQIASAQAAAQTSRESAGGARELQPPRQAVPPSGEGAGATSPSAVQPPQTVILRTLEPPPSTGPAVPQEPALPLVSGPRSGRLIWSGMLTPDQVLTIDAGRPSFGSMAGRLPGGPVRVRAYPAELSGGGLTVFTADPVRPGGAAAEPAGPRNSWMATTWRHNPQQAQALQVVETPRADNGWQRLSLRAAGRAVTVVVVEWETQ